MFTKADIEKYFNAEKQGSLLFLGIALAAIIAAAFVFFILKSNFNKGAAIPLLVFGLLLGAVGIAVYARSDNQRITTVYAYDKNPAKLKNH